MDNRIALALSGGMDSTSLLLKYLSEGCDVHVLTFDYGQRHRKEIIAAKELVGWFFAMGRSFSNAIVDISAMQTIAKGSSLTSDDVPVPEGHYEEPTMKQTVVPNRNCIFLSLLSAYAIARGIPKIAFGAHAGDHAIYPDCREEFVRAMQNVVCVGNYESVQIVAPFLALSKGGLLVEGIASCKKMGFSDKNISTVYSRTWTCYKGCEKACGKCGACRERLEAFQFAGMPDPVLYE